MDFKRILRAPLFWFVAVVAITLTVFSFSDAGGYARIDTSAAQQLITEKKVERVVITNNVIKHDSYGIFGTGMGYGNAAINYFLINGVVTRNVLAGGRSADYPAGNLFPSVTSFQSHFVDYPEGDFALVPGTDWANAGTDSIDLGADIAGIRGGGGTETVSNPSILTAVLPEQGAEHAE